jgi:uncharacterized protein
VSAKSPARLRGHHLICLQFFRGEGYSAEFVANLEHVVERAQTEGALIVAGIDNVCAVCPELGPDSRCASVDAGGESEIMRIDQLALEVLGAEVGERLTLPEARESLEADAVAVGTWRAQACDGCAWESVCESGWNTLLKAAEQAARRSDTER